MSRRWPSLLMGTVAIAATATARAEAIVGGHPAELSPFVAYLTVAEPGRPVRACSGVLVAARYVATAAHCVTSVVDGSQVAPGTLTVYAGKAVRSTYGPGDAVPVARVARHPTYDAGVLELAHAVPYEGLSLSRPDQAASWRQGARTTVFGWGRTGAGADPSDALLSAEVPLLADGACAFAPEFDPRGMLCIGGEGAGPCEGDSGGPVVGADRGLRVLLGTVSRGACGTAGVPDGYVRLIAGSVPEQWMRSVVPQASFTVDPARPDETTETTLTSTSVRPSGQPYPQLAWDLDGDGGFDDASGTSVKRRLPAGTRIIGLQGADPATGDREVTRRVVEIAAGPTVVRWPSAVGVREGRSAVIPLSIDGRGTGRMAWRLAGGARRQLRARSGQTPVQPGAEASIRVPTASDRRAERDRSVRVALQGLDGLLAQGPPDVRIAILDDDLNIQARRRRRTVKIAVRIPMAGRVVVRAQETRRGGRRLARRTQMVRRARTLRFTFSLVRPLRVRVTLTERRSGRERTGARLVR